MKMYTNNQLPRRNEYVCGGFGGLRHIVVNYKEDGSVIRTINGKDEYYATQADFQAACDLAYESYLAWLDKTR